MVACTEVNRVTNVYSDCGASVALPPPFGVSPAATSTASTSAVPSFAATSAAVPIGASLLALLAGATIAVGAAVMGGGF